jgi:hypothetical protein
VAKAGYKFTRDPRLVLRIGGREIRFESADLVDQSPTQGKSAVKRRDAKGGRKYRQVLSVLPKLYPPDGKVPDSVSTETVRQEVIADLTATARLAAKLKGGEPKSVQISWETANRALGRDPRYPPNK